MSRLYPSVDVYSQQLRELESFHRQNPDAAYASFLLAYHYLTCGHLEAGAAQLDNVLRINPQDLVAKQLLESIEGQLQQSAEPATTETTETLAVPDLPVAAEANLTAADFQGNWMATNAKGATFRLALKEDGTFEWTATRDGNAQTQKGVFAVEGETLAMEPETGGVMLGKVTRPADGVFKFEMVGALPDDAGLEFKQAP